MKKEEVVIGSPWRLKNGYHVQVISKTDTTIITKVIGGETIREHSHENFHKKHTWIQPVAETPGNLLYIL